MKLQEVLRCIKSLPLNWPVGTRKNSFVFYLYNFQHKHGDINNKENGGKEDCIEQPTRNRASVVKHNNPQEET
jgi:hypothetical protein